MKYFFFFNSFISTSPSQPPILINFFLLGLSSYCVKFAAKTEEDLEIEFFCVSVERKTKNHNRRLIPSFSIKKKNKKQNIFTIIFDYSVLPRSIYRKDIHFSLNSLNVFLYFMCDQ